MTDRMQDWIRSSVVVSHLWSSQKVFIIGGAACGDGSALERALRKPFGMMMGRLGT